MTPPPGEFPIAEALSRAFGALIGNLDAFVTFVAVWTVVGAVLIFLTPPLIALATGDFEALYTITFSDGTAAHGRVFAEIAAAIGASVCISVSWYRYVILHERPGHPLPAPVDVVWSVFWRSFLLDVPPGVLIFFVYAIASRGGFGDAQTAADNFALYVVGPVASAAMAPFFLVLPWSAVGDHNPSFAGSLRLTRGHSLGLFLGLLVTDLPFTLMSAAVDAVVGDVEGMTALSYASDYLTTILDLMSVVTGSTFLALAYLHFTQRDAPEHGLAAYFE